MTHKGMQVAFTYLGERVPGRGEVFAPHIKLHDVGDAVALVHGFHGLYTAR